MLECLLTNKMVSDVALSQSQRISTAIPAMFDTDVLDDAAAPHRPYVNSILPSLPTPRLGLVFWGEERGGLMEGMRIFSQAQIPLRFFCRDPQEKDKEIPPSSDSLPPWSKRYVPFSLHLLFI